MATVTTRVVKEPENGLGTAGLVMGIIALLICLIPVVGLIGAPLALIGLGLSVPGMIRANAGRASNFGSAVAGVVLSTLALLVCAGWLALGVLAAAGDDDSNSATNAAPAPAAVAENAAGTDSGAETLKFGKSAVIDEFGGGGKASFVVHKVDNSVTSDNPLITPEAGNKFVAVHVGVKNSGRSPYKNVSWFGAKVYTNTGQAYDANPLYEAGTPHALPSNIDLKPGGSVNGWIMFEIPAEAKISSVVLDDVEWKP